MRGMMVSMKAEEARGFYEEDEDPAQVFALFDAASKGRTEAPERVTSQESGLTPLPELLREVGSQLRQDLGKLRLRDRLALLLRQLADTVEQHPRA
jgi:hypothetical protein